MFSRGSRFIPTKATGVPGPGAYNPQDPDYDAYKRGAFLEQTNRFDEDKESDVPGPGAYGAQSANTQNRPPTRNSNTAPSDKLANMQRKLEELERVHAEGKKAQHLEQERLKHELNRAQRTAAEQRERADKLNKQNEALDARVQELKKTSDAQQAELREMRMKLRTSEHERTQLAAKQGDAAEARKAEARRRDEVRERDRKIGELEKSLGAEKKKREAVEARLQEAKAKTDERVHEARVAAEDVEGRLREVQKEAQAARDARDQLRARTEDTEEELVAQLEQHRYALTCAAQDYGRLASTTIALSAHQRVKHEAAALQLRNNRLERKLANSDSQVGELAHLIRQVKDENAFLTTQLREAQDEADVCRQVAKGVSDSTHFHHEADGFEGTFIALVQDQRASDLEASNAIRANLDIWSEFDRLRSHLLIFHASVLDKDAADRRAQHDQRTQRLSEAEAMVSQLSESLERSQSEHADAQRLLADSVASVVESNVRAESLKKQLEVVQADTLAEVARAEEAVKQGKRANQRMAAAVHQAKQAEQFLRAEVEHLTSDLAEAEKFQEAYEGLLSEVDALVMRNTLAEDEAQRLSRFNAEILGHNNPAQRIVYVDRIRRELHETKHKLLLITRDRDAVGADNDDLRAELELYKSVAVSQDAKPRTTITRVARLPTISEPDVGAFPALHTSNRAQGSSAARSVSNSRLVSVPERIVENIEGDMTLDEIL